MQKLVATLRPADIHYASSLVTAMKGPANERIVAAYTISEALKYLPKGPALDAVYEDAGKIVTQPFHSDRAVPHSVEELENSQAKSFSLMEVDALAERAAKDPDARDRLIRMGSEAKDPFVQKYILEKVKGLR